MSVSGIIIFGPFLSQSRIVMAHFWLHTFLTSRSSQHYSSPLHIKCTKICYAKHFAFVQGFTVAFFWSSDFEECVRNWIAVVHISEKQEDIQSEGGQGRRLMGKTLQFDFSQIQHLESCLCHISNRFLALVVLVRGHFFSFHLKGSLNIAASVCHAFTNDNGKKSKHDDDRTTDIGLDTGHSLPVTTVKVSQNLCIHTSHSSHTQPHPIHTPQANVLLYKATLFTVNISGQMRSMLEIFSLL